MQLLSQKAVCERLGIGRTTLWRLEREGDFPRSISVTNGRRAYLANEVDAWVKARAEARAA
jgi:prophage regulatory protein